MINIIRPDRVALTPAEYAAERDKALLDFNDYMYFAQKYLKYMGWKDLPRFKVIEITFHQLRTACRGIPMDERTKSKKWLLERHMQPWDDGDVPT